MSVPPTCVPLSFRGVDRHNERPLEYERQEITVLRSLSLSAFLLATLIGASVAAGPQDSRAIPPAIGPHVNLKPADFASARSFRGDDRIVMTYYFYWYDVASNAHIVNGD